MSDHTRMSKRLFKSKFFKL